MDHTVLKSNALKPYFSSVYEHKPSPNHITNHDTTQGASQFALWERKVSYTARIHTWEYIQTGAIFYTPYYLVKHYNDYLD